MVIIYLAKYKKMADGMKDRMGGEFEMSSILTDRSTIDYPAVTTFKLRDFFRGISATRS